MVMMSCGNEEFQTGHKRPRPCNDGHANKANDTVKTKMLSTLYLLLCVQTVLVQSLRAWSVLVCVRVLVWRSCEGSEVENGEEGHGTNEENQGHESAENYKLTGYSAAVYRQQMST